MNDKYIYAIEHDGNFPTNNELKKTFGHDIIKLYKLILDFKKKNTIAYTFLLNIHHRFIDKHFCFIARFKSLYRIYFVYPGLDAQQQLAALQRLWQKLWSMDLRRAFSCDFEEYRSVDPNRADIRVYIGLKPFSV